MKNVFVAGAGFMGNGIAQMAALAGYRVTMSDISRERLDSGTEEIKRSLGKFLSKGKITDDQLQAALENLSTTTTLDEASGADIAVEAVPEDPGLKKKVFGEFDRICPAHAILATNTSAIPVTSLAAATARPEKVVGTHFFGPVPLIRLCEVIRGLLTSDETLETADAWARSLGKETVVVRKDRAGFIANRVMIPASLEAIRMVEEGIATPSEIDRAITMGLAPGPLQITDNAGVDVSLSAAVAVYEDSGDPKFFPPPLMRRMVAAGLLGRKTGRGFYDYPGGRREDSAMFEAAPGTGRYGAGDQRDTMINRRFFLASIIEAVCMLEAGFASPGEIDRAVTLGFNLPAGPLAIADGMGIDIVVDAGDALYGETGYRRFLPPATLRKMAAEGLLGRRSGRGFFDY